MTNNIGEVNYKQYSAQKFKIIEETEKNINSLFERDVIDQSERDNLLHMYLSGEVSFGSDGLTASEAMNFTKETYAELEKGVSNSQNNKTKTLYVVQPGDTPEILAEKLGLSGNEATDFVRKVKAEAIKDGVYYKYGFMAGDMIALPGNFDSQIEKMRNDGVYLENTNQINKKYKEVRRKNVQKNTSSKPQLEPQVEKTSEKEFKVKKGDPQKVKTLKKTVDSVVNRLSSSPGEGNKALDEIKSENIVFVLSEYNKKTGRKLAQDLFNNTNKNSLVVKNKICWNLAKRAQELKVGGIYFGDYQKITDNAKLLEWINNAQNKLYEAEVKENPAIKDTFQNKKYVIRRSKSVRDLEADGKKLANELFEEIDGAGSDADNTRKLLKKITSENAAYVVKSYLSAKVNTTTMKISHTKKNSSHRPLAKDLVGENGFDIKDVKEYICKKLYDQAKNLGLTGIYYGDFNKINDIDELVKWIEHASWKIMKAMDNTSSNVDQGKTETKKQGDKTVETLTNQPLFKEAGITKVVRTYGSLSSPSYETRTYYKDGKIVREYIDPKRGRVRELVQKGSTPTLKQDKIYEAIDMKISLPQDASNNAKAFARALEKNKKELMAKLNLDNDTYDRFAQLAMAIAKQETNFGNNGGMYRKGKYATGVIVDNLEDAPPVPILGGDTLKFAAKAAKKFHDFSYGPTQVKFDFYNRDEWYADKFKKLGIEEGTQLYDMEKSAIATIIVLAGTNNLLKGKCYQDGIEAARGNVVTTQGWEMKNGHLEKTYNTKSYVNKVTDEDALCYAWNKGLADIKDGTMEPEAFEYTRNVHKYLKDYSAKDVNPAQRKTAIQKSKSKQVVKNFKPMDNNGPIGSIAFMPKMYNYSEFKDHMQVLEVLRTSLNNNSKIDSNSKKLLLLAVERGEVGFEFGLTEAEANSLTQKDVDMILSHIGQLKTLINSKDQGINFEDGINSSETEMMKNKYMQFIKDAELSFKKSYLASKTPKVSTSGIPQENILNNPMNNDLTYSKRAGRRGFAGNIYDNIPDEGVNSNNTSQASAKLAKFAQETAKAMNRNGYCMTGFRQAIKDAGIDDSDLTESIPRTTVKWFERHPDMFEEVKFINIGGGNARQINSTDLPNLPAGYFVVWIPDQNNQDFKNKEGHISITNGNGQAYADETDNLDWGVYHGSKDSGKGEHGTFRVFRLTDKWKVENGKLKFGG